MSRLLFKWTDNALIAANTGRPFTRSGLEALCSSHLSDKMNGDQHLFGTDIEAREAVDGIRKRELMVYRDNFSRVIQDARLEVEMGRDYTKRLLLELMQNADDAAATVRIGYKGLGFKSVLDIAESARIYSSFLRVAFDRERSKQVLQEITSVTEVPVLRLPFWNDADSDPVVGQLLKQYNTVIVLPWKNGVVPAPFGHEWKSVRDNASVLLLLHALEEVIWEGPQDELVEWRCERNGEGDIPLSVTSLGCDAKNSLWRIYREPTANLRSAVVVRLDSNKKPQAYQDDKIRVFFPTNEESPLPLILHGEFDLKQSRDRVREGGNRSEVVQSLARCVKLALTEITDDGNFLDLLQPRIPPENMTGLEREVWDAVSTVVCEMELPVSKVKLLAVRLCPTAVDSSWYSERLNNWKTFKELLVKHRPTGLTGLSFLPPGTDTEQREQTICAFNTAAHLSIQDLLKLKLFPVTGCEMPVSASDHNIFFPAKDTPAVAPPPGVRIAFLCEAFATECQKHQPVRDFLGKLGVAEFSPSDIAVALAKSSHDAIPEETLWQFLLSTVAPMLKEEDAVMDWKDEHRQFLAEHVKVQCRNGVWQLAVNVYAGKDWTGDDFLERACGSKPFLISPPVGVDKRKQTERLARWLGVGWSPKVVPIANFVSQHGTKRGVQWRGGLFPIPNPPMRWQEHCAELDKDENGVRKARLRQDWTIDGDATVLQIAGAFACITHEWKNYKEYCEAVFYRSSNRHEDYDNERHSGPSYLSHLLRHIAWIPTTQGDQPVAAQDVFLEDSEVHHKLAGWVFSPATPVNADVAKGIGIRRDWSEVNKADWKRWLKRSTDLNPQDNPEHQKHITILYQQALRRFGERNQQLWTEEIWCIEKRPDNTTVWHREADHSKVYYIDRPDLARLRLEMFRTFPVELARLEGNAQAIFRITRLSEHLCGEPNFIGGENGTLADRINERLQKRTNCLASYLKVKGIDFSQALQSWKELYFHVGIGLQVVFSLDGQANPVQSVPTFFQPRTEQTPKALWLDAVENVTDSGQPRDIAWEEVGSALCYAAELSLEDGAVFAGLIGCGEDSLRRKLLNLGVTEADVANAVPHPTGFLPPTPPAGPEIPPVQGGGHPPVSGGGGGGGNGGGGGGGENRAHRELKDKLWEHPELIETGMQKFRYEPDLASHYRPDLILKDAQKRFVTVEVESEFPGESDYGVWQAVAYKHVVAAMYKLPCDQVRGMLVAPRIPDRIKQQCSDLGIEPVEVQLHVL
jgi:hypothetical protein